jgi:myo-inositol catabolism protein IolC
VKLFSRLNPFATIRRLQDQILVQTCLAEAASLSERSAWNSRNVWIKACNNALDEVEMLDQAIAAHMDERVELTAIIQQQSAEIGNQQDELDALDAILLQAANFVTLSREMLSSIGISVETGEDGRPALTINKDELLNAIEPLPLFPG